MVYQLILKSKEDGYTEGSFKAAWDLLIKVFKRTVKEDRRQLKTQYLLGLDMKPDEDPMTFTMKISELDKLRIFSRASVE